MTINRDGQKPDSYQGINPRQNPQVVLAQRAPAATDRRYPIGTNWVDQSASTAYILVNITNGSAVWALSSPGASDVDTLTGDSGGALSPTAGNITIAGGTNITTAGAGSTITTNLDAAISLATSVTSPIYTTSGADMAVTAAAGQDIDVTLGDASGANKVSFIDTGAVEVAQINSDGAAQFDSNVTTGGNLILSAVATYIQMNGGAVTDFIGQATLTAGTVTVANTNIAAGDRIFLTRSALNSSSALGELVTTISAATSFTITSVDVSDGSTTVTGDTSIVDYVIIRQN